MRGKWSSIIAVLVWAAAAAAQTTALTYQGRLKNGGEPASGLHDFRFRLFDAAQGGSQLGTTQCLNNLAVADGLFTAAIDFGQQFASPDGRFLDIQVREDTGLGCGNGAGFVTLAPRQPLTAAPLASQANSAFALDAADGGPTDAVFVDDDGFVGIGTSSPLANLHIVTPGPGIRVEGSAQGPSSYAFVTFADAAGTDIGFVGDGSEHDSSTFLGSYVQDVGLITAAGRVLTATAGGNVGIGTDQPLAALDVRGNIRLGFSGEFRATAGEENLRIIRGRVGADGARIGGSGFTSERTELGRYVVTFTQSFADIPTVTATTVWGVNLSDIIAMEQVTHATVTFAVTNPVVEGRVDTGFHFTAIGPR